MTTEGHPASTPEPTQAGRQPEKRKPRWPRVVARWIRRILAGVVGFAVVAVAGVVIALHTDWGREQLRKIAEAQLAKRFPGGAHIGALEGSVFGELVVRDLELDGRDGKPM